MNREISIVWFRQDLRLSDNPAFLAASETGAVLPIYIHESFKIGNNSKIWLHNSLKKLNESLNNCLNIYNGRAAQIIELLIQRYNIRSVFWNICYEPWHIEQENAVKKVCMRYKEFNGNYLWLPEQIIKDDGGHYKVFTAYKNRTFTLPCRASIRVTPNPKVIKDTLNQTTLGDLKLQPNNPWYKNIEKIWDIGEKAAQKKLEFFIKNKLCGYKEGRNYPAKEHISRLSPHLHFGEISPAQILQSINQHLNFSDIECFTNEIIWREFSCYLLYHFKYLHAENFNTKFNNFPWENNSDFLQAWQKGNTGFPLIDAGMRELWQTGYMHNRVRMIVASFLVKNLNIHWQQGMEWFWDCLVDADLANNSTNWQWVAGSGVDAAPYFRIFNPIIQGEKFDANGDYTKRFVPELKNMPNKYLFTPWKAPKDALRAAGVTLDDNYPMPIVDFACSRDNALTRYKILNRNL